MRVITLNVPWDDGYKEIRLSEVTGTGSIWWNIMIGTRVYGNVYYRFGEWIAELNPSSELCFEDGQEIIDIIKKEYPELNK